MADASGRQANGQASLIARFERWRLKSEPNPRLALHLHGDEAARRHGRELIEAISELRDVQQPLSLDELNAAVASIGERFGLAAYASEARCVSDPLATIVDTSFFRPATGKSTP